MTKRGTRATAEIDMTAAIAEARAAIGTPLQVDSLRSKLAMGLVITAGTTVALTETSPTLGTTTHAPSGVTASAPRNSTHTARGDHNARGLRASNGSVVGPTSAISITKATLLAAVLSAVGTVAWLAKDATISEPRLRAPDEDTAPPIARPTATGGWAGQSDTGARAPRNETSRTTAEDHATDRLAPPMAAQATPEAPQAVERLPPVSGTRVTGVPVPRPDDANGPDRLPSPFATRDAARGRAARAAFPDAAPRASRKLSSARTTERSHATEVELLTRAQALIDLQPSAALTVLREHELAYPSGLLREERDVLRIDAEWALGQRKPALTHARAFVQLYPRSTQTRRFETLLSDHKNQADSTPTE